MQEKRAREDTEHRAYMAKLDAMLDHERQRMKDAQIAHERGTAIRQKEQDIEKARASVEKQYHSSPRHQPQSSQNSTADRNGEPTQPMSTNSNSGKPDLNESKSHERRARHKSLAKEEWEDQKKMESASNDAIDAVMDMVGLEEVKLQILKIKAKIDANVRQNSDMKDDRLNVAFLGNPGTGQSGPQPQHSAFSNTIANHRKNHGCSFVC